jgi:hypothetical protein
MLRRIVLASAMSALFAGGTLANAPANVEECMNSTLDLAEAAEEKKLLGGEQVGKAEELLLKMGEHCEANQFTDAMALAQEVKAMIERQ